LTTSGDLFISGASKSIVFNSATNFFTQIYETSGSLVLQTGNNPRLTLASTGAATFSSSVTSPSFISDGGGSEGVIRIERDTVGTNAVIGALNFTNNNGSTIFGRVRGGRNSAGDGYVSLGTGLGDNLYALEGGNVGIGTASPAVALDLGGSTGKAIHLYTSGVDYYGMNMVAYDGGPFSTNIFSGDGGAIKFRTNSGSSSQLTRMSITSTGNVGIGTASPQSWTRLEVAGTAGAQTDAAQQVTIAAPTTTVGHGAGLRFNAASGAKEAVGIVGMVNEASGNLGAMTFHTYGGGANIPERMRITSGGNVNIAGSPSANTRLTVNGADNTSSNFSFVANNTNQNLFLVRNDGIIFAPGIHNLTTSSAANVVVFSDGSMARSTSSIKYKKNVEDYSKGLDEVLQMRPVFYEGISETDEGKTFAGLIAEEVHDLGLTEFVQYAEDGSPDSLAYQNMVSILIKAIQEQQEQINQLKNQIK
jgi:hypothetical protein